MGYARQIAQSAPMSNGSLFPKAPGPSHNGKVYVCSPYVMDSTLRQLNAETMGYIKVIVEGVCVYMCTCVCVEGVGGRNGVVMGGVVHFINKLFIACNTFFFCVEIIFDVVLRSCTIFQTLCTQYPCHCLW